jgi:xanthine/uracil permease
MNGSDALVAFMFGLFVGYWLAIFVADWRRTPTPVCEHMFQMPEVR